MKRSLLCSLLVLALSRASAQKINVDSLVSAAISVRENAGATIPHNPDSLLQMLFITKSPVDQIRTGYDIILLDNGE